MSDFKMTGYMNRYAEELNRLDGLKAQAKNRRETLIYCSDPAEALEEIKEIEAEIAQREPEVDDLYCLAHFGKHRTELAQANTIQWQNTFGMEYKPH